MQNILNENLRRVLLEQSSSRTKLIEDKAVYLKQKIIKQCKICKGTGRLLTDFFREQTCSFKTMPCECRKKFIHYLDLLIAGVDSGDERSLEEIVYSDFYEREVVEVDIATGKKLKKSNLIEDHVNPYIQGYEKVIQNGYSYLFIGINSLGKTFVATKILHNYLKYNNSGHFIKFRKLMKLINKSFSDKKSEKLLHEIYSVDLLIIDELGKETGSQEHISGEIEELLKDRDYARKPTIVITNEDFDELKSIYSIHIFGAFMRNYRVLIFNPKTDFRKLARREWNL